VISRFLVCRHEKLIEFDSQSANDFIQLLQRVNGVIMGGTFFEWQASWTQQCHVHGITNEAVCCFLRLAMTTVLKSEQYGFGKKGAYVNTVHSKLVVHLSLKSILTMALSF